MTIQVRFFASLRERMGRADAELEAGAANTVGEVWAAVAGGEAMPDNLLMAINQDYVQAHASVADGDEVAFFPPVTGG
ncbi:molybdopterin converting factor subunit 1 [Sulfuriflexus mobilis]|uniref:molybdopterin converting factor subunit 1 n=1 Tax=Sulfuriflexus mobilis TaxID=1811807 RepID=UPI000F84C8B6|nr:molybdopterin converting factor subunit 1 [Sulfuriflexus mobilis]